MGKAPTLKTNAFNCPDTIAQRLEAQRDADQLLIDEAYERGKKDAKKQFAEWLEYHAIMPAGENHQEAWKALLKEVEDK